MNSFQSKKNSRRNILFIIEENYDLIKKNRKKLENLMHKSTQYCADTTKTGSVHAVDMRGYKRYAF